MKTIPLIDARAVAQTFAMRREVVGPARRSDGNVIPGGRAYGSVLRDRAGEWRMWYLGEPVYCEYYATSSDGLEWDLPALDMVSEDLRRELSGPNAFMSRGQRDAEGLWLSELKGPEGFCVLDAETTPHPAARKRFTAMYLARFAAPDGAGADGGLCLAHSDDGVCWLADERNPLIPGWRDTSGVLFYDPRVARYVVYSRPEVRVNTATQANRLLCRMESEDLFRWSSERIVLDTDEQDADSCDLLDEAELRGGGKVADARERAEFWARVTEGAVEGLAKPAIRGRNRQWYGITAFPYANLTVGLGWMYDLPTGEIWVELLHSYDGIDWRREPLRRPWMHFGRGRLGVTMASPPVEADGDLWIYCSSDSRNHHGAPAPDAETNPPGVFVTSVGRDRWVAYVAREREGELVTQVLPRPERLTLNASVAAGGHLRTAVLDEGGRALPGLSLEESEPPSGDGPELEPRWRGGASAPRVADGNVRLRIVARNASLYAIGL